MTEKKDKLRNDVSQEVERQIDRSNRKNESFIYDDCTSLEEFRDITKMQAPDNWPDAPEDNNDSSK